MTKTIETEVTICSAHRLALDYPSGCKNLHGHNWKIKLRITGRCNQSGMLVDFTHLKNVIQSRYDHQVIMCDKDPLLPVLLKEGTKICLMNRNPTAENLCDDIAEYLSGYFADLGGEVWLDYIRVEETENNYAELVL